MRESSTPFCRCTGGRKKKSGPSSSSIVFRQEGEEGEKEMNNPVACSSGVHTVESALPTPPPRTPQSVRHQCCLTLGWLVFRFVDLRLNVVDSCCPPSRRYSEGSTKTGPPTKLSSCHSSSRVTHAPGALSSLQTTTMVPLCGGLRVTHAHEWVWVWVLSSWSHAAVQQLLELV